MRLATHWLALALAATTAASPLVDVVRTTVQADDSRAKLDQGIVSVQISRIDDLVSDGGRRLLERVSHVSLEISLGDAALLVNGQPVFELANTAEQATVSVVRADALLMPGEMASTNALSAQAVEELKSHFSKGLVSVEVHVESEVVDAVVAQPVEGGVHADVISGVGVRRVGVFVKLNEVEGVDLAHTSLVMVPIVQLLVRDSATGRSHVSTLSINGQAPSVEMMPGVVVPEIAPRPPTTRPSVAQRIAGLIGVVPQAAKGAIGRPRLGRPCAKHQRPGGEVPEMDVVEHPVDGQPWRHIHGFRPGGFDPASFEGHRAFHHHRHGRHGFHLGCMLRRIGRIGSLIFGLLFIKLIVGLTIGLAIARAARARRAARHAEETDGDSEKTEPLFEDEDELPAYAEEVEVVVEEKPAREGESEKA